MQVKPLVLIKALAMLHIAVVQGSRKEGHSIHLTPLCRVSHPVLPYPQCTLLGNHRYFGPSLLDIYIYRFTRLVPQQQAMANKTDTSQIPGSISLIDMVESSHCSHGI